MLSLGEDEVEIYGYPDYTLRDTIIDLKTTGSYAYYKYEHYWQRYAYPYIMLRSQEMAAVSRFEFLVAQCTEKMYKGEWSEPVTNMELFSETYDVDVEDCEARLATISRQFIAWIAEHCDEIDPLVTHIFG